MKSRKTVPALLAAAATVAALAGCSSAGSSASDGADGKQITLQVMSTTIVGKPEGSVEQKIADAFMKAHPNITIKFIGVASNDYNAKITTSATGGNMPDIFADGPELATRLHDLGVTEDLGPLLGQSFLDGFQQNVLKQGYVDNKLQYAPYYTIPQGLLYRKDLFDAAGLKAPRTWDEFVADAKKLTVDTNHDGQIDRWGFAMIGSADGSGGSRFVPVMRTFGSAELVQDNSGQWATQFDSPGAVSALQLYGDLVNKDGAVPPGVLQTSFPQAVNEFSSDKAAMMITGPNAIGGILAQNPSLAGKLASAPLPAAPGQSSVTVLGQLGFAVSAASPNKQAAAEYIKFFLSKQNQIDWTTATGRLPVRTDAATDPAVARPELKGFLDAVKGAVKLPAVPYYPNVQIIGAKAYQAVIGKQMTAQEAAKDAAEKITQEIKNNG